MARQAHVADLQTERKRRVRPGQLPEPPEKIEVPYGQERPELKDLSEGEQTMVVASTLAYEEEFGRICKRLDDGRAQRGPKPSYSSWECELVFLYQRVCGLRAVREARDRLAGDRGADARRLFGFDKTRVVHGKRKRVLREGVPSEATLSRHRRRFGMRRRMAAYERLFRRLGMQHLEEFPEMREESRLLGMDGSAIKIHGTCPIYDKRDKEKVNPVNRDRISVPDGGFVGGDAPESKRGHGYNGVFLSTFSGLPLASTVTRLHDPEAEAGRELIKSFKRDITPLLEEDKTRILVTDGNFHNQDLRRESQDAGLIQQTHEVSHANPENAETHDQMRREIAGYPHWYANGHDEIQCKCGQGRAWKEVKMRDNKPVIGTGGNCPNGERISITPGIWRLTAGKNGRWVRCQPEDQDRDYAFGNPLTYNDPLATIYGYKRFGNGEGLYGQLVSRYQLLKGKRWFRCREQARTDVAMVFSIMHALAMEQRRRAAAGPKARARGQGPPLPKAA